MEGGGVLGTPMKEALDTLLEVRADTSAEMESNTLPTKVTNKDIIVRDCKNNIMKLFILVTPSTANLGEDIPICLLTQTYPNF